MATKAHDGSAGGSTQQATRRGENPAVALVFGSNRKAALKLGAAADAGQFWDAAQAMIAQAAPSSTRWLCIRPKGITTAMMLLRETPSGEEAPAKPGTVPKAHEVDVRLLNELLTRHPAILHFQQNSGVPFVRLNPEHTEPGPSRWRKLSDAKFGVALAFWKRKQLQGVLILHRTGEEGDFLKGELRRLRELHPHLETALCRILAARRHEAQKNLLAGIFKPLPLPLVLCDWRLHIVCESAEGLEARARWEIGEKRARTFGRCARRALPPDLAEFCRGRMELWEKAGADARVTLEKEHSIAHPHTPGSRVAISMVRQRKFPLIEPFFLIRFGWSQEGRKLSPSRGISRDHFAALAPLSACERELALLVCEGHGNAQISEQIGKSVHTVKAQLRSVFVKLQVKSRAHLIALFMRGSGHVLAVSHSAFLDEMLPIV